MTKKFYGGGSKVGEGKTSGDYYIYIFDALAIIIFTKNKPKILNQNCFVLEDGHVPMPL